MLEKLDFKTTRGNITSIHSENKNIDVVINAIENYPLDQVAYQAIIGQQQSDPNAEVILYPESSLNGSYIELEIDHKYFYRGWQSGNPFQIGDNVEVVASEDKEYSIIYAIRRPKDRLMTVFPQCYYNKRLFLLNLIKSSSFEGFLLCIYLLQIFAMIGMLITSDKKIGVIANIAIMGIFILIPGKIVSYFSQKNREHGFSYLSSSVDFYFGLLILGFPIILSLITKSVSIKYYLIFSLILFVISAGFFLRHNLKNLNCFKRITPLTEKIADMLGYPKVTWFNFLEKSKQEPLMVDEKVNLIEVLKKHKYGVNFFRY